MQDYIILLASGKKYCVLAYNLFQAIIDARAAEDFGLDLQMLRVVDYLELFELN